MLKRLSIRSKLGLIGVLPLAAMVLLTALAWATVNAVKVGSPAEQKVVDSQSVVADVLPPPLFVVEPLLVVSLASQPENAAIRADLLTRYDNLKREYTTNHDKWVPKTLPPLLRKALLVDSYDSAQRFFTVADAEVIPRIKANDAAAASIVATKLVPIFDEHRRQILTVISEARDYEIVQRADVATSISDRTGVFLAALVLAMGLTLLFSLVVSRTIRESIQRLRRAAEEDLPRVMEELRDADDDVLAAAHLEPVDLGTRDELADAANAFNAVLGTAVGLAAQQTVQRRHTSEMFVNLGRRNQNLVARQLKFIDSLERTETDGDRLSELFRLDNLATRMRRNAESLLVLAGVEPPRRWRKPVRLYDVVRAAMAEIEEFRRVEIGSFDDVLVQGSSVANVTHLLAELLENAARFSPPDATVAVSGVSTGTGYLLGIHDRGLGMPTDQLSAANARLVTARRLEEVPTAYLGLYVVARLAQRESIAVELESPDGDGLTAWVRVPQELLASAEPDAAPVAAASAPESPERSGTRRLEVAARADEMVDRNRMAAPTTPVEVPVAASAPVAAAAPTRPSGLARRPRPAAAPAASDGALSAPPPVELSAPAAPLPDHAAATGAGLPRPAGAPLPPPTSVAAVPPVVVLADDVSSSRDAAGGETRSGFKKRTRAGATVEFDRFADRPAPTGNRSAEDMKDRLDRFSAGKRFAAARTNDADAPVEDDE